jgi:hypothetical protein
MIITPPQSTIDIFKQTPGAISMHEMLAIGWLTEQAPRDGVVMDIGTNAGKGAIAEAIGYQRAGIEREMMCIDTVFDLDNKEAWSDNKTQEGPMTTGWAWIYEPDFKVKVMERIERAGGMFVRPYLFGESALTAIPRLGRGGVAFAFCDADNNQKWLVDGIVDALAQLMVTGGIIAHHDHHSQFIAPHEAQDRLIATGEFEKIKIPWEEVKSAVDSIGGEHPPDNLSWHHKETARPMFVGAIRKK